MFFVHCSLYIVLNTKTMRKLKSIFFVVALALILSAFKQNKVITIFMIGDSTMANKSIRNGNLERGWGMALPCYFDEGILIDNHAVNGRSSKSFIDEGRWQTVVERIKPGDYVFIQFGHNDEKPTPDLHTDPGTTFDDNLRKFVRETRERGGIPVLFNSVVRRNFMRQMPQNDDEALRNTTGATSKQTLEEGDTLVDTHGDYLLSPRNVAQETGAIFIDANRISHDLEQGMGREESKKLHMWFLPGQEPSVPQGRQDNTHYNVYGAHRVAGLLADVVAAAIPALKDHVVHYDISVATDGTGDYFDIRKAVDAAPEGRKTTIQLFPGKWKKPDVPAGKDIKFIFRDSAEWR